MTQRMIVPVPTPFLSPAPSRARLWRRPLAVVALAVSAGALLAVGCGGTQQARVGPPAVPVTVGKVVEKTMPVSFRAIGHVEPIETVSVKARIGGELQKIGFQEGDVVSAGQTLFIIDPRPYEAAVRQAEAQLARDQALLKKADDDTVRYAGLVKQDYVTKEDYDQITATAASLAASVAADQANLENARLNLEYCTITAPVGGRTGNLNVKLGNLIKADDSTAMVTINRTTPIYVSFPVSSQFLPGVLAHRADGIKVQATVPQDGSKPEEGTLTFIDNTVDTSTATILLKGTFPNQDEGLWPGQFVDVTVTLTEEPNRVVCPSSAVQTAQQGQYVFVVKDDNTVEERPVKVARMDESNAVIASGLSAGETVVTDGQLRLVSGSKVELKEAEKAGSSRT